MNLVVKALQNNFGKQSRSVDVDADLKGQIFDFFGNVTRSGVAVTPKSGLKLSAVYNAIDQISNDLAKLPKQPQTP